MNGSEGAAKGLNDPGVKTISGLAIDMIDMINRVIVVILGKMCQDGIDYARMADAVQTLCEARKVYSETVDRGTINQLAGAGSSALQGDVAQTDKGIFGKWLAANSVKN